MKNPYALKMWTRPECYVGATWEGWLVFLGRNRDSDLLTNHNFDTAYERLSEVSTDDASDGDSTVRVVSENHWAVGWVEWIAIHPSNTKAVALAEEMAHDLDAYPVLDEDRLSEKEHESADESWDRDSVREMLRNNGISERTMHALPSFGKSDAMAVLDLMNSRGRVELLPEGPYWGEYGSGRDDMAAVLWLLRRLARGTK